MSSVEHTNMGWGSVVLACRPVYGGVRENTKYGGSTVLGTDTVGQTEQGTQQGAREHRSRSTAIGVE